MSWSEIKKSINSNLGIPLDVLVKAETKKVDSNLSALFNELLSKKFGEFSVVRSVQRGVFNHCDEGTAKERVVIISEVNPSKCIVLINDHIATGGSTSSPNGTILQRIGSTEVVFVFTSPGNGYWTDTSWQVIEFY